MKNYSVLAKYYDRFSQNDCDYESWSQYLCAVAKKHNVKNIVDVACGTGKMTRLLVRCGFNVVGVDQSQEMLQQATDIRAVFVRQDMKKLSLTRPADMAVVVNDGINYLKPSELLPFFVNLAQNIRENAPLVFDVSSEYKLQKLVGNNVFFVDDADATLLWTNKTGTSSTQMQLTLFEKSGSTYTRQDESHTQYIHTVASLSNALCGAGFSVKEISADYGKKLRDDSLRVTFYAVKTAKKEAQI